MRFLARLSWFALFTPAIVFAANQPPVVSITAPATGTTVVGPTTVALAAAASSPDSTIASVTYYYAGTTKIGAATVSPYNLSWKAQPGTYSVTAVAKDKLGVSATSSPVSVVVTQDVAPTVTLTVVSKAGAFTIAPATLLLSATASSTDSTVKSVTFSKDGSKLATVTSATGTFTYTLANLAVGTYSLSAVATDALGTPSAAATTSVTVSPDVPPAVSLTAPASGLTVVGPTTVSLAATATSSDSTITSVTFQQNGQKLATVTKAPYTYAWKGGAAGSYALTAVAVDAYKASTSSAPVSITIQADPPPTVSITAPASGASVVGPATVKLAATASSALEAVSTVTYYYQNSPVDTKIATTKAPFSGTWTKVPPGSYSVYAVATDTLGVTGKSSPVALTVTQDVAPSVALVSPIAGATYAAPATVELLASASSPDTTITSVAFYQGTSKVATVTKPPYAYALKLASAGTYTVSAVATDAVGTATTSAPVTFTVTAATTSTVKITAPASGKVIAAPASVTIAASATAPAGVASVAFYANGALLGTAASAPYQFAWQNIPTGVYYLTAVATDAQGNSVTSAPVTFTSDTAPTVSVSTPGGQSVFAAPATINLSANVTSPGTISKVVFYNGSAVLATLTAPPYLYTWTPVGVGTYSVSAKATDSLGVVGASSVTSLQVVNDPGPSVTLATPPNALTFSANGLVSLAYSVTDPAAAIAKVEIYRNGTLAGTLTAPSAGSTWTWTEASTIPVGTYAYYARAYDAAGISAESAPASVLVAPVLPYSTDFEAGEGAAFYTPGPVAGQGGWANPQGSAAISTASAYSGAQSLQLAAGSPVAVAQQTFAPATGETVVFCDFYALPVAEASITASTLFTAEQAQFGFVQSGGQAVLQVYRGNGAGSGTWAPTGYTTALGSNNRLQGWIRLTARLDFTRQTWDLYANGAMVAYDIPFISASSTSFSSFQVQGDASTDSFVDLLQVVPTNPLFTDANNDGINDAWEQQYGLSLSTDDRYLNLSGDGVPVIQDYVSGASPFINTAVTPDPVTAGLVLHLRADAAVVAGAGGAVSEWLDQSGNGNNATQSQPAVQPTLAAAQLNGMPALSFSGSNSLVLPAFMLQSATAGEIISVVKVGPNPNTFSMLWNFGTGFGTSYYNNNLHFDDFGTSDTGATLEDVSETSQYFIYDTAISASGTSTYSYNGVPRWVRSGLPIGFQAYPDIGGYGNGSFVGAIAEVMVYSRVLTDAERTSVNTYLLSKYAFPTIVVPAAPSDVTATPLSSDAVDVYWTAQNPLMHTVATVYRSSAGGPFVQVAQVSDAASYTDTGLAAGASYAYQVTVQSYAGTSGVSNTANVTLPAGVPDITMQGMVLWLRTTAGTLGTGPLSTWRDQSGQGDDAVVADPSIPPSVAPGLVNGLPAVQFNGSVAPFNLPPSLMGASQAGQIFAVVEVTDPPGAYDSLWAFGTGYGTTYILGGHFDDFGTSDTSSVAEPISETSQFFLYDTSITSSGTSVYRYDGAAEWTRTNLPSSWPQNFVLGAGLASFNGSFAEVIVYNRVLSPAEQADVYAYLAAKYALPNLLGNLGSPYISSPAAASVQEGQAFTYSIVASNSPTGYAASGLPAGLSFDPVQGLISGTPTADGVYSVALTASNSSGSGTASLTLTVTQGLPVITSAWTAAGQVGAPFSFTVTAAEAGGNFTATGLPAGLSIDPNSGIISGTPTAAGTSIVTVSATNPVGTQTGTLSLVITGTLPVFTSGGNASGTVGQAFSFQVSASNAPTSFSATGLPLGLNIDPGSGLITGTPYQSGSFTVTVTATNVYGPTMGVIALSVAQGAPGTVPVAPGLVVWLAADTGFQVQSVSGVPTDVWQDLSGSGNSATQKFQSGGAFQAPTAIANVLNGHSVMRFNPAQSQYVVVPYAALAQASAGEMFVVVREPSAKLGYSAPSIPGAWTFGSSGTFLSDTYGLVDDFLSTYQNTAVAPVSFTSFNLYDSASNQQGNWYSRINGKLLISVIANQYLDLSSSESYGLGSSNPPGFVVGFGQFVSDYGGEDILAGGGFFDGDIAEILIYNRNLSDQERAEVGQYLEGKYNLPNIVPATTAPTVKASGIDPTDAYLSWTVPSLNCAVVYTILRQTGSGPFVPVGQTYDVLSFVDSGLVPGATYNYEVVANTYAGGNATSSTVSATTLQPLTGIPSTGLQLWLRSDVGVAGPGSGSVGAWGDQSGQGNFAFQPIAAELPTASANAVNGMPVVHFNATKAQFLSIQPFLQNSQAAEMFVVLRSTGPGYAYTFGPNASDFGIPGSGDLLDGFMSSVQYEAYVPGNFTLSGFNSYNVSASSAQWVNWLNGYYLSGGPGGHYASLTGAPTDPNATVVLGSDAISRGAFDGPGPYLHYFTGDIAELIVYNRTLSDSERLSVGQYLQARYSLPVAPTPTAPAQVAAAVDPFGDIDVTWASSPNAAGYNVFRNVDGAGWVQVAFVGADGSPGQYVDTDVQAGTVFQYEVQAVTFTGLSALSAVASSNSPFDSDPVTGLPYWFEADDGHSALPNPPTEPTPPPSGPPGSSPPVITLTIPSNATLH